MRLWGAEWYFLPENPTLFVRRNRKIPHYKNTHRIYQAVAAPPYPQRICRHSPWQHPPWTGILVPRLLMSLLQAPCARVSAHCGGFPCLGRHNGTHQKIERCAEHRSWVAAARWFDITTNQRIVSAAGRSFLRRRGRGRMCGEDFYSLFWAAN